LSKAVLSTTPTAVIVNYDSLIPRRKDGCKKQSDIKVMLAKWGPELLVVDEMHYTKNAISLRSKAVYDISKGCKWVLGLTGTPIPKNPLDVFGQYKILDDRIFGTNFNTFKKRYSIPHYMFPSKIIGWLNLEEMSEKIHSIACRVTDKESTNLPDLIVRDLSVELTPKSKKVYKQMAQEMIAELDNMETVTAAIAAVKVGKLQQITGGFLMREDIHKEGDKVVKKRVSFPVGTEKLDVFMDLVNRYQGNHKILVGCKYLWELAQLESRLKKGGVDYVIVKGGVSGEARSEARRRFQTDEKCRIILFQVSAATAMTLTAGDIGILYSCTTKWDDYWQWLKRIHREGQTKPVYIIRLIAKGTVDKDIMRNLEEKRSFTDNLVDKSTYRNMLKPKF
jgi:SNF2 family DNA or RNA helicase